MDRRLAPASTVNRQERLAIVLDELERRFGRWIVYRLTQPRSVLSESDRIISSGSLSLDLATGIDGFRRGRLTELVGPSSSGKSVIASHLMANAQRQQGFVALVDTTHQADIPQIGRCGVNLSDLLLAQPDNVRDALTVAALLVESGSLDVVVIGPLSDLVAGDSSSTGGQTAEQIARLNAVLHTSPAVLLFLSDQRLRGPISRALRHFASLRVLLTPLRPLLHPSQRVLGLRVRLEIVKNKLASSQRRTELDLRLDRGIHRAAELVDLGLALDLIENDASSLGFGGTALGRGRARAITTLELDSALAQAIESEIRRVWVK